MIAEGFPGGGESQSARKAYAQKLQVEEVLTLGRPPKVAKESIAVTFTDENEEGVMQLHDDALVVTLTVVNYTIHQILNDNESTTNILYWPAFK